MRGCPAADRRFHVQIPKPSMPSPSDGSVSEHSPCGVTFLLQASAGRIATEICVSHYSGRRSSAARRSAQASRKTGRTGRFVAGSIRASSTERLGRRNAGQALPPPMGRSVRPGVAPPDHARYRRIEGVDVVDVIEDQVFSGPHRLEMVEGVCRLSRRRIALPFEDPSKLFCGVVQTSPALLPGDLLRRSLLRCPVELHQRGHGSTGSLAFDPLPRTSARGFAAAIIPVVLPRHAQDGEASAEILEPLATSCSLQARRERRSDDSRRSLSPARPCPESCCRTRTASPRLPHISSQPSIRLLRVDLRHLRPSLAANATAPRTSPGKSFAASLPRFGLIAELASQSESGGIIVRTSFSWSSFAFAK